MEREQFGRYEIKAKLGKGGMGMVYHAYDPRFKRDVALKVLDRRFSHDPKFLARFQREAKAVAQIDHPGVVPVYDYGDDQGELFLVMQLMQGGTLTQRLKEGPLSVAETTRIFKAIAPPLDHTHKQGMVHRDLKPDNILFDEYDVPHVADFGIVKLEGSQATMTQGNMVGTPAYMSPEQVSGKKDLDGRSDIYSLGVILFQMLTGKRPYQADTPIQMVMQHVMAPVPSILEARPDLPTGCEHIIRRAMSKEPAQRYQTVAQLVADLENIEQVGLQPLPPQEEIKSSETVLETAIETLPNIAPSTSSRRVPIWLLAVIVLLLGGVGGIFLLQPADATPTPTPIAVVATAVPATATPTHTPTPPTTETAVPSPAPSLTPTPAFTIPPTETSPPTDTATPAPVVLPISADTVGQLTAVQQLVRAAQQMNWVSASPNEQLMAVAGSQGITLYNLPDFAAQQTIGEGEFGRVDWSKDGRFLASSNAQGVQIWDSTNWAQTTQLAVSQITALAWSADNNLLIGTNDGRVLLWDTTQTTAQAEWDSYNAPITRLVWSPDGTQFAAASLANNLCRYTPADSSPDCTLYRQDGVWDVAWSPDGTILATAGVDNVVRLEQTQGGALATLPFTVDATALTWLDNNTLAIGTADGQLHLWPIGQRQIALTAGGHADVQQVVWLPSTAGLLTIGNRDQTVRLRGGDSWETTAVLLTYASYREAHALSWSPDNEHLAVGTDNGVVNIWSAQTGQITAVLGGHTNSITGLAWSPDGSQIATIGQPDNSVRVWEAATGLLVASLQGHSDVITAVSWSPDSTQVASSGRDGVIVWDVEQQESVRSWQAGSLGQVLTVAWSPDGTKLVLGGQTNSVQIRPLDPTGLTITLNRHTAPVQTAAWATDGSQFVTADTNGRILVWPVNATNDEDAVLQIEAGAAVRGIVWGADNTLFAAAVGPTVRFWKTADGSQAHQLLQQHRFIGAIAWSVNNQWLATVNSEAMVQLWQVLGN